jgi:hypothetical protein
MPDTPKTARIDRLLVSVPGSSAEYGRQIATLVAAGLANAGAWPQAGDLPTLRVTITAGPQTDAATLARRIVAATLRDLARIP